MQRNPGLKCRIELLESTGGARWVRPDRPFYSGDRIRIHVESNIDGRLSILQQQDNGVPQLLFPDKSTRGGDDVVEAGRDTMISLEFDESPGRVRLMVLLMSNLPIGSTGSDPRVLMAHAEKIARSKGLRIDVDSSGSEPAKFAVKPASNTDQSRAVATELLLVHSPRLQ